VSTKKHRRNDRDPGEAGSDGRRYDTAAAVASGMAAMRELASARSVTDEQ
jgi:hypothetical protein